jgi:hypothetical protein
MSAAINSEHKKNSPPARRIAHCMRALGREELPAVITVDRTPFHLVRTVKHDFYAATGFYENDHGRHVVVKIGRTQEFSGLTLC